MARSAVRGGDPPYFVGVADTDLKRATDDRPYIDLKRATDGRPCVLYYKNLFTASSIGAAAAECTPPSVFALYAQDSNSTLQVPS